MHELSMAVSLVDAILEATAGQTGTVDIVRVRVGDLAGVDTLALLTAFEIAVHGTAVAGCRLEIDRIQVTIWCEFCQEEILLAEPLPLLCPRCETPASRIVHGKELELDQIVLTDDECPEEVRS